MLHLGTDSVSLPCCWALPLIPKYRLGRRQEAWVAGALPCSGGVTRFLQALSPEGSLELTFHKGQGRLASRLGLGRAQTGVSPCTMGPQRPERGGLHLGCCQPHQGPWKEGQVPAIDLEKTLWVLACATKRQLTTPCVPHCSAPASPGSLRPCPRPSGAEEAASRTPR